MSHYTATVTREGKWWMIRIPELDGLTQARRLDDAEDMAREYIAVSLDIPIEDVTVDVTVDRVAEVDVASALLEIRNQRAHAAQLDREASERSIELAKQLAAAEIPVRDIGAIMGVSFQRAHQLVKA